MQPGVEDGDDHQDQFGNVPLGQEQQKSLEVTLAEGQPLHITGVHCSSGLFAAAVRSQMAAEGRTRALVDVILKGTAPAGRFRESLTLDVAGDPPQGQRGRTSFRANLLAAEIDPNGNRTDYQYDANQRLVKVIQPPDETSGPRAETTYTYDDAGRQKTTTDPVGRTTERFCDQRGRVVKILYGDGSTERFLFGSGAQAGLLVKQKDRGGVVTDYEHNYRHRVVGTTVQPRSSKLRICQFAFGWPKACSQRSLGQRPRTMVSPGLFWPKAIFTLSSAGR